MKIFRFNNCIINFDTNVGENYFKIEIETNRLILKSLDDYEKDLKLFQTILKHKETIEKYSYGVPLSDEEIQRRLKVWIQRLKNKDPFAPFKVFLKETGEFIGFISLAHSDNNGISELSIAIHKNHWNKGYGYEMMYNVVHNFSNILISEGIKLNGESLKGVIATARVDNFSSQKIIEKVGFKKISQKYCLGYLRNVYEISF